MHYQPIEQKSMNRLCVFNELGFLALVYFCFLFTDFVPDPNMRYRFGWWYLSIAGTLLVVNFSLLIWSVI